MQVRHAKSRSPSALGKSVDEVGNRKVGRHPAISPKPSDDGNGIAQHHFYHIFPGYEPAIIVVHRILESAPFAVAKKVGLFNVQISVSAVFFLFFFHYLFASFAF